MSTTRECKGVSHPLTRVCACPSLQARSVCVCACVCVCVCVQLVVCFSVDRYMHCVNPNKVKAFLQCEAPHHQAQACRSNV